MTTRIMCDICNSNLEFNETKLKKNMLGISKANLGSKYVVATEFEGTIKRAELCLMCAIKLRNYLESEKIKHKNE